MTATTRNTAVAVCTAIILVTLGGCVYRGLNAMTRSGHRAPSKGSSGYCLALRHPGRSEKQIRDAVAGRPGDFDLADLRAAKDLFYRPRFAEEVPTRHRPDARLVLSALRRAITAGAEAPLNLPAVQAAIERLTASGDELCRGVLSGR